MADDRMEDDAPEVEEVDLRNPDAVTKYKVSADIANKALSTLIKECVPGKKIADLCLLGDKIINDETKTKYTKGKIERGVAFPTCISVDNCVGHYSPLSTDETVLQEGNLVKIDLGAHIDGFICTVAHTVIATATPTVPVTGRKADVICAAHFAAETALRLMRPGKKNTEVTEAIEKVAQTFHCNPVEGVLSHQMKRFVIDGNKVIISKPTLDQKVEEFVFEENEVYAIDIVMSTGEGKPKETEARTTVYKRAVDQAYSLKMKAARYVFNEINAKFSTLPFAVRAFEDENRARLGIVECLRHALVHPYPVLFEKPGEFVAQFKFTVLLLPSSISKLTSHDLPFVKSEYSIADLQIKNILALGTKRKSKSKKAKKKKKVATAIEPASTTTTATTATNTAPEAPSAMDTAT